MMMVMIKIVMIADADDKDDDDNDRDAGAGAGGGGEFPEVSIAFFILWSNATLQHLMKIWRVTTNAKGQALTREW